MEESSNFVLGCRGTESRTDGKEPDERPDVFEKIHVTLLKQPKSSEISMVSEALV